MIKKEDKATRYVQDKMFPHIVNAVSMSEKACFTSEDLRKAYLQGWDEALKSQWVDADESLPDFDDVERIENKKRYIVRTMYIGMTNEISYNMAYMRSRYKFNVETDRVKVTHWMPIPSFDEILEANKDVLKRLKDR